VAVAKQSGIFQFLAIKAAKIAKGDPWKIMMYLVIITAVCSAFLDNVTTVLLISPMTFTICKILDESPIPFFMTQILASNVGGTATLIGDPPNIMIGSGAGLTFADFINYDGIACVLILVVFIALFYVIYGRKLTSSPEGRATIMELNETRWEIERQFRDYAWLQYNFFMKRGMLDQNDEQAARTFRAGQDDGWVAAKRGLYDKMIHKEVRDMLQRQMDLIVERIYQINKPQVRKVVLTPVKR
jgi:Mg2+/citrate symporter